MSKTNLIKKFVLYAFVIIYDVVSFYGVILFQVILFIISLKFNGEVPA